MLFVLNENIVPNFKYLWWKKSFKSEDVHICYVMVRFLPKNTSSHVYVIHFLHFLVIVDGFVLVTD